MIHLEVFMVLIMLLYQEVIFCAFQLSHKCLSQLAFGCTNLVQNNHLKSYVSTQMRKASSDLKNPHSRQLMQFINLRRVIIFVQPTRCENHLTTVGWRPLPERSAIYIANFSEYVPRGSELCSRIANCSLRNSCRFWGGAWRKWSLKRKRAGPLFPPGKL